MYERDDVKKHVSAIPTYEVEALQFAAKMIGKIIKRRQDLGWTQSQLAKKTGIKQSNISRFEAAETIPRVDTLLTITFALGMKVDLGFEDQKYTII
ncbi:helix-turn-helix domain-containing protein [Paenibacillus sp. CF384]|uniref:helix-turn-helix domain-containing protein n=1 Tax=Paenibacillus sp. CF384 TaxID=1884382 RepID=UPI0008956CE2|nr:helix-turn-helix transcriptional regulator [Paenibacillus sp. CF384]SDX55015.1 Helix-turn-helix [Paenibacillus sp. CF384]